MRGTARRLTATVILALVTSGVVRAAAPAPPTYFAIERTIESLRKTWSSPGGQPSSLGAGWSTLFDSLVADLKSYATAQNDTARLGALSRLQQISATLATAQWPPAANLDQELRQWLEPRLRLASAGRMVSDAIAALPATSDEAVRANRAHWVEFVQNDLGRAFHDYDGATTVAQRQESLHRVQESLRALSEKNRLRPWGPATELEAALSEIFNQPNLEIAADVTTVAPIFEKNLVDSGPVLRKGYLSQVTAGPKTGFGLLASDDGIAFFNRQTYVSVTPIWDFQNQIASDQRGQRAAKLYQFSATTVDQAELTITTVIRPSGLGIYPSWTHAIDASINSAPTEGAELGRTIACLIGMNQQAITNRVYEGSIGRFREQIPIESREEGLERIAVEQENRNADLKAKYLVGNDTAAIKDVLITGLVLRSRPEAAFVAGVLNWRGSTGHLGADLPQPASLTTTIESGVTADVHVGSLLTSLVSGLYGRDDVRSVQNLMITIRPVPPGTSPGEGITVTKNTDFATFAKAVDASRKPGGEKQTVMRITRPQTPPEFSTDNRGFLVALIHDVQIDVPAPEGEARGGLVGAAAKIYRVKIPLAEISLSYKLESSPTGSPRIQAKVEEFNPGANAEVLAIADDENKGVSLSRFSAGVVMGAMGGRLRTQSLELTLDQLKLPGVAVRSISPLDPSGWVRVALSRTSDSAPMVAGAR